METPVPKIFRATSVHVSNVSFVILLCHLLISRWGNSSWAKVSSESTKLSSKQLTILLKFAGNCWFRKISFCRILFWVLRVKMNQSYSRMTIECVWVPTFVVWINQNCRCSGTLRRNEIQIAMSDCLQRNLAQSAQLLQFQPELCQGNGYGSKPCTPGDP